MKPTFFLLPLLFAMSHAIGADGSRLNSNEEVVAEIIKKHDELAQLSCERIKGDVVWRQVAEAINSRLELVSNIPENEWWPRHIFVDSNSRSASELMKSEKIYWNLQKDTTAKIPSFRAALTTTRAARVLRICGEDFFKQGLLPKATKISADEFKKKIDDLSSYLKQHDEKWMEIARSSRGKNASYVENDLETATQNAQFHTRTGQVTKYIWFPMHDLHRNGDTQFASDFNFEAFREDNEKAIVSNRNELNKERERTAQSKKNNEAKSAQNKERELRINRVKDGDIKSAKSCTEVAVGLIGEKNLGGNYEMALSKDFQDVYVKPTNELYAGIGKVIDSDKGSITLLQSDEFRKKQFLFTLKHGNQTVWFGDKASHGAYVTFVGRYVDNTTVQMRQGNDALKMQSRVYDAVCVSSK